MQIIIEARVESTDAPANQEPKRLAVIDGVDDDLDVLSLSLEGGRQLISVTQSAATATHV
jgi:hypothetical protein